VIDAKMTRLAATQRAALRAGRSSTLTYAYADGSDELAGAWCDGTWFGRAELLSCMTCTK
jgi:hypothetical protein